MKNKFLFPLLFALATLCAGCEKQENGPEATAAFDPSKPVEITDFTPKTGGIGQRLLIYGKNFGNDTSMVRVFIGRSRANLIGVHGDILYCMVPGRADSGIIELSISNGVGDTVIVEAADTFKFVSKTMVSSLFGYKNSNESQEKGVFGKYPDARTFDNPSWLRFDPLRPHMLYMGYDGAALTCINLQDSTYNLVMRQGSFDRLRSIDFTLDSQYMIIANDQGGENDPATLILSRYGQDFTTTSDIQVLTRYRQCNTGAVHPVNGELYFNSFERGQVFRYDLENANSFGGSLGPKNYDFLFSIQDNDWEFRIQIHPTGNYAYIMVVNRHYILRTDYNWETKQFQAPYLVCGEARISGWVDGVGAAARLFEPYQGVFVKNPDYAGNAEEYDFYFTEIGNHDIRKLTPDARVTTFAGRGTPSLNGDPWGYVDGEVRADARFDRPTGLAYDEATETFYVGDWKNYRIRIIQTL